MYTTRILLLVTLLAALCLAIPTPAQEKRTPNVNKKSFKVERSVNRRALAARQDPKKAMGRALRKYGLSCEGTVGGNGAGQGQTGQGQGTGNAGNGNGQAGAQAGGQAGGTQAGANQTQNENGEVTATPADNEALFLSPVKIGGQTLNMDFDTGSSDLWVFSTQLSQAQIGQHAAFNPAKSANFKLLNGEKFDITYGDGSFASGVVGTDTVDIGGATVQNQAVELAQSVSQSFIDDTNNDGLVGLAFSTLNTVTPTQQKTFFDTIMNDLEQPLFTADLTNDTTGTYEFGTIDNTKFKGNLAWIKVQAQSGFWQFDSTAFTINGKKTQNAGASPAIADTGTSLLLVDDNVAQAYYTQVKGAVNDANVGGFTYPCNAALPNFGVAIGNGGYVAEVPGNAITFAQVDAQTCFGGVQGNGGAGIQIYGDVMFKSQFVVFNGGNQSLGIAPKAAGAFARL